MRFDGDVSLFFHLLILRGCPFQSAELSALFTWKRGKMSRLFHVSA
jgi:hypothetical protein